jgi:hypothetical protein
MEVPPFVRTINAAARCREAAAMCRETATLSASPDEWLIFADDWDRTADQADWISAWKTEFDVLALAGSVMQAIFMDQKRTIH